MKQLPIAVFAVPAILIGSLALLAAIVVMTPRSIRIRWDDLARFIASRAARAVALPPPLPPSLHVLAISRT